MPTPRQVQLVRDSFGEVRDMGGTLAQIFYARLFTLDPSLRPMFRNDLQVQGAKLVATLTTVLDSAHALDTIGPQLRDLGRKHLDYGTKPEHYDVVASALLWSLHHLLGNAFDAEVLEAWSSLVDEVIDEMRRGAADA
jgi:hemoglobin-like flavoprotein